MRRREEAQKSFIFKSLPYRGEYIRPFRSSCHAFYICTRLLHGFCMYRIGRHSNRYYLPISLLISRSRVFEKCSLDKTWEKFELLTENFNCCWNFNARLLIFVSFFYKFNPFDYFAWLIARFIFGHCSRWRNNSGLAIGEQLQFRQVKIAPQITLYLETIIYDYRRRVGQTCRLVDVQCTLDFNASAESPFVLHYYIPLLTFIFICIGEIRRWLLVLPYCIVCIIPATVNVRNFFSPE